MKIEQMYTKCLAEAAYYIESNGEVAIIDPMREIQQYIDKATENNSKIKYVFETHFHADFVSGHVDLAEKTGATIVYGPTTMQTGFKMHVASDGETFKLGDIELKLIHTPGHTMESSCLLLIDENGTETALFSGDTLFIGDVGRPDLAQHVIAELTQEKLANHLFDSLRNKIMPLADDIIVYPNHGAGSACGKNMSKETSDTLGHQKAVNYALRADMSREEFVKELLSGLTPPPGYFPQNVLMNINGYEKFDAIISKGTKALSVDEFEYILNETDTVVIDTRNPDDFEKEFIPTSINIGIDGSFAVWVGTLIPDVKQAIALIVDKDREEEVVTRLARVGYNNPIGFLNGGIEAWKNANKSLDCIQSITPTNLACRMDVSNVNILDVRKESEFKSEHIIDAINAPLDYITDSMTKIDRNKTYYVHCAGGYRSMIFVSILQAKGFRNLINVKEGFSGLKNTERFKITEFVCPTSML